MRIKEGFDLRDVCGENVLIATGRQNIDFSKVISLNESAALLWHSVAGKDFTVDDMVNTMLAEYEVGEEQARADVSSMLDEWKELGFLED